MKKPATLIHVNQHVLRANIKHRVDEPMLTCKHGRRNTYAHEAVIHGPSRFVNGMHKPLSCGARVWLRTESDVEYRLLPADAPRHPTETSTIIRVNSASIRANVREGTDRPVLTFARGGEVIEARELIIHGPAIVRTSNLALAGEGRIWIETDSEIECVSTPLPIAGEEYQACAILPSN